MLLQEHAEGRERLMKSEKKRVRVGKMKSSYDENGSYTGTAADGGKPVQDADDL